MNYYDYKSTHKNEKHRKNVERRYFAVYRNIAIRNYEITIRFISTWTSD